ncbi:hypothetical protein BYT27DRAFT_7212732 [Phlegmacium glaucopus]|nr:hypothetical protein BYT27DRAFT_7212732 [Phlegmacium glaucopus]
MSGGVWWNMSNSTGLQRTGLTNLAHVTLKNPGLESSEVHWILAEYVGECTVLPKGLPRLQESKVLVVAKFWKEKAFSRPGVTRMLSRRNKLGVHTGGPTKPGGLKDKAFGNDVPGT